MADCACLDAQVSFVPKVKRSALQSEQLDRGYYKCWSGLQSHFTASKAQPGDAAARDSAADSNGSA